MFVVVYRLSFYYHLFNYSQLHSQNVESIPFTGRYESGPNGQGKLPEFILVRGNSC
jgi:hypothetical protein